MGKKIKSDKKDVKSDKTVKSGKVKYRIITHGNCADGFCSAYIFKKYFYKTLGLKKDSKEILDIEVIGVGPQEIQGDKFELTKYDIVLDLPRPKKDVFFWCDHHSSNKPDEDEVLPENYYWRICPSNASLMLDIAKENGLKITKELSDFKRVSEIMDGALYSKDDINTCFYPLKSYDNPSPLLRIHLLGDMFHTRDFNLNVVIFKTMLNNKLAKTPIDSKEIEKLNPLMFHLSQLEGLKQWREVFDTYVYFDKGSKCVVQDDRKLKRKKGVFDRFYPYVKFKSSAYNLSVREDDKITKMGIGSNIFHRERLKIDIGKLCETVAKKFGEGAGGGHREVGGLAIDSRNTDEAIEFILSFMKENNK